MGKRTAESGGGYAADSKRCKQEITSASAASAGEPHLIDSKHANGGDALMRSPDCCEQEFALRRELVDGAILQDLAQKRWRVGKPIGEWTNHGQGRAEWQWWEKGAEGGLAKKQEWNSP